MASDTSTVHGARHLPGQGQGGPPRRHVGGVGEEGVVRPLVLARLTVATRLMVSLRALAGTFVRVRMAPRNEFHPSATASKEAHVERVGGVIAVVVGR